MKIKLWSLSFVLLMALVISCDSTTAWIGVFPAIHVDDDESKAKPELQSESDERTDPVLFEGWTKPLTALFVSGRQTGYIEPCGCTGLSNQKGGLMRRHTLFKELLAKGWDVVPIDSGNQVRRFGKQPNLKMETTLSSLIGEFNYQVISYGKDDVKIPLTELVVALENSGANFNGDHPFVCANITLFEESYAKKYKIIESGGKRIAITAVLSDEDTSVVKDELFSKIPVNEALATVVPMIEADRPDFKILIANANTDDLNKLIQDFPNFDLVIATDGAGEPTQLPTKIVCPKSGHETQKIQVGTKGMYVGIVGLYDNNGRIGFRYQRVPLDDRFEDSEEMKVRFKQYQDQLQRMALSGLEIKAITHPSGNEFIGSEICSDCHDYEYEIWKNGHPGPDNPNGVGPHFRATDDLTDPNERVWVKRHHDPECISCHVTGWNPQNYYPYKTGYLKLEDTLMHGNGCENCHGPGSAHADAEDNDALDAATRRALRKEMIVTLEEARANLCQECHDLDNSPDFHKDGMFDKYWKKIEHNKKED